MAKKSAGILVFKRSGDRLLVFLAHPGGPFWAKKDRGSWSIPKGELNEGEDAFAAACREFSEEIGQTIDGSFMPLTPRQQPSRKMIYTWAVEGNVDEATVRSNEFEMEWPPQSGKRQRFPEVDRAGWFAVSEARERIQSGQLPILEELIAKLGFNINEGNSIEKPRGELF